MQIKINSTQALSINSTQHVKALLNNFGWHETPTSVNINIDSTLKDVDDKLYVQLVTMIGNRKISFIADAVNITYAITAAMQIINGKIKSEISSSVKLKKKIKVAA